MNTAIVTDFLNQLGGAERVTAAIAKLYPDAEIYTLLAKEKVINNHFSDHDIIQHPKLKNSRLRRKFYRKIFPLYPTYIEDFDLREYDLVISSSYLWAKGVICNPDTVHISYIHTPMRQAWAKYHDYLSNENDIGIFSRPILRFVMNYMRIWDVASANRVDYFIANSSVTKKRINTIYRREAEVIYPPIPVKKYHTKHSEQKGDYYITVGRLVPYKKIDLLIETFNQLRGERLIIIGDGNDRNRLQGLIQSNNIEVLGYVEEDRKNKLVADAKAFLFAAEEDFGMSPVESMALGTPVVAYSRGGTRDYIVDELNGCFFDSQSVKGVKYGLQRFKKMEFRQKKIMDSVTQFDESNFCDSFKAFTNQYL